MYILPHMPSSTTQWIDRAFAQLKDGDKFKPSGSEKIFTKMAGVLVAPDLEAYTWIKSKTSSEFFNKYVVRIMYSSHHPS